MVANMVAIKVGKHKRLEKDKFITSEKGHTTEVDTIHDIRYSENFVIFFCCKSGWLRIYNTIRNQKLY